MTKYFLLVFSISHLWAVESSSLYPDRYPTTFLHENTNYSLMQGRVSDRDQRARTLKIQMPNHNTKFLKSGDPVRFKLNRKSQEVVCQGRVLTAEKQFFSLEVLNSKECDLDRPYLRRGAKLSLSLPSMRRRLGGAKRLQEDLIQKRRSYLNQLANLNQFIWSFREEQNEVSAEYDKKIVALQRAKLRALEGLTQKQREGLKRQQELRQGLVKLDKEIDFARIERQELDLNRPAADHDLGLPVERRPEKRNF